MKEFYFLFKATAVLIFAVLSFALSTETTVLAQRPRPVSVERREEQLNRQIMDDARDDLNRELKAGKNKSRVSAQLKLEQIKKDFEEMQAGYNRIAVAMADKQNFDFNSILSAVAEVNKNAVRLKENLALPYSKADADNTAQKSEEKPIEIRSALLTLEKHIYSFVTNPIFEAPSVLDLEQAGIAGRDLEKIIELSENIKKNGDKLTKPAHR
jgi:hypothetical protein